MSSGDGAGRSRGGLGSVRAAIQGRGLGSADPGLGSVRGKGFSGRLCVRRGMLAAGLTGRGQSASGPGYTPGPLRE
jgi:hypothetical protein